MTQDVRQWLAEIKALQQKLTEAHQERDEAYASAANWRSLYETEAKQRRTEANLTRKTIESLKEELQEFRILPLSSGDGAEDLETVRQQVEQLHSVEELKQYLMQTLLECDRLTYALRAEQAAHTQTRNGLTAALGDTVDMLTQERTARNEEASSAASFSLEKSGSLEKPEASIDWAKPAGSKIPLLDLPQFDQAQSPS